MQIPDRLIPGLNHYSGLVLIKFVRGTAVRAFKLRKDEFVTSLRTMDEARVKAGLKPFDSE